MLTLVPYEYLQSAWLQAGPQLDAYLSSPELHGTIDDIYRSLLIHEKNLWVDLEGDKIKFSIITMPETTATGLAVMYIMNSGSPEGTTYSDLDFQGYRQQLEDAAKALGFQGVVASTRAGLAKEYQGYHEIGRVLFKRF